MSDPLVRYELSGGVATVTLDSPGNRNALSSRLVEQLAAALDRADADAAVRVVVLTGTGPVFCAGADLKEARDPAAPPPVAALPDVLRKIDRLAKPSVCRVNGGARAGGIGLLAACDITVAAADARFAFSEVRIGVVPAVISVPVLRRVAAPAALELMLTGEVFDGSRAAAAGLLNRAVVAEHLDAEVERYVDALVRGGPESLRLTRQVVREVPALSFDEALERMTALSVERFASDEAGEGMTAFAGKRDAAWVPAERRRS